MEDKDIIELYFNRDEQAIVKTSDKYGNYCNKIVNNILNNVEDTEECVNDAYLNVWNNIPPTVPKILSSFIAAIARNCAFDRYKYNKRAKRGYGDTPMIIHELEECISDNNSIEKTLDSKYITHTLNDFLLMLNQESRTIFMQRYWYASTISDIATKYNMSESKVKSLLFRLRNKLKEHLENEEIML